MRIVTEEQLQKDAFADALSVSATVECDCSRAFAVIMYACGHDLL